MYISHNTPGLPPPPPHPQTKKTTLRNLCFLILLDITVVPREIKNNAYTIFFKQRVLCEKGELIGLFFFSTLVAALLAIFQTKRLVTIRITATDYFLE